MKLRDFRRASIGIGGMPQNNPERLLTPRQVADRFAVDPKTVTRWAKNGKLPNITTIGGHRRFRESIIDALCKERVEGPVTESE